MSYVPLKSVRQSAGNIEVDQNIGKNVILTSVWTTTGNEVPCSTLFFDTNQLSSAII